MPPISSLMPRKPLAGDGAMHINKAGVGKRRTGEHLVKNRDWNVAGRAVAVFAVALSAAFSMAAALAQQAPATNAPGRVTAGTNTAAEAVARQMAAVQAAVEATEDVGKPMVDPAYRPNTLRALVRVQRGVENNDYRNALQACESMTSDPSSPSFRKMLKDLAAVISLQANAEQTKQANDARDRLASVSAVCAAATNQGGLQSLSAQLQQTQNALSRMSDSENSEITILRQNLQNAQEMIRMSMNCLAAESSGDLSKALDLMSQIMSMSSYPSLAANPEMKKKLDRLQSAVADETSRAIKARGCSATRTAILSLNRNWRARGMR